MNDMLRTAAAAVGKARDETHGFSDTLAKAAIGALQEPTTAMIDSALKAFHGNHQVSRYDRYPQEASDHIAMERAFRAAITEALR